MSASLMVVWSMDVVKLYPSLKAEELSKMAAKAFLESSLEMELDTESLALYLALTVEKKELVSLGLGRATHTRKAVKEQLLGLQQRRYLRSKAGVRRRTNRSSTCQRNLQLRCRGER